MVGLRVLFIFFLVLTTASASALADVGIEWDYSQYGVIYRQAGEVRLILCPGEWPDSGAVSRTCDGGKTTTMRLREAGYAQHLLIFGGMPKEYQSPDALVKLSQDLEMAKRALVLAQGPKAQKELAWKVNRLEELQHSFRKVRNDYLAPLERETSRLFKRDSDDWTYLLSSFSYWVGPLPGYWGSKWAKVSFGTWYDLTRECFPPWKIWTSADDYFKGQLSTDSFPTELLGQLIWTSSDNDGLGVTFMRPDRYPQRGKGETHVILCIW